MPVAERCISWRAHKIYRSHNREDTSVIVSPEAGSSRPPPHESGIFFFTQIRVDGPWNNSGERFQKNAVWVSSVDKRPVRKNLHQLWGFIFFKTIPILVSPLHSRSRLYDRSRSTATRTYKSNKFRLFKIFGNGIFFYTTRPSRAPTQSIRIRAILLFQCPDRFVWMGL